MDPGSISLNDIGDPFLGVCDEADGIVDIGENYLWNEDEFTKTSSMDDFFNGFCEMPSSGYTTPSPMSMSPSPSFGDSSTGSSVADLPYFENPVVDHWSSFNPDSMNNIKAANSFGTGLECTTPSSLSVSPSPSIGSSTGSSVADLHFYEGHAASDWSSFNQAPYFYNNNGFDNGDNIYPHLPATTFHSFQEVVLQNRESDMNIVNPSGKRVLRKRPKTLASKKGRKRKITPCVKLPEFRLPYALLAGLALKNSENTHEPVRRIYNFITAYFNRDNYYDLNTPLWKNALRHALATDGLFARITLKTKRATTGKWGFSEVGKEEFERRLAEHITKNPDKGYYHLEVLENWPLIINGEIGIPYIPAKPRRRAPTVKRIYRQQVVEQPPVMMQELVQQRRHLFPVRYANSVPSTVTSAHDSRREPLNTTGRVRTNLRPMPQSETYDPTKQPHLKMPTYDYLLDLKNKEVVPTGPPSMRIYTVQYEAPIDSPNPPGRRQAHGARTTMPTAPTTVGRSITAVHTKRPAPYPKIVYTKLSSMKQEAEAIEHVV